jgi:hypothetical protein
MNIYARLDGESQITSVSTTAVIPVAMVRFALLPLLPEESLTTQTTLDVTGDKRNGERLNSG